MLAHNVRTLLTGMQPAGGGLSLRAAKVRFCECANHGHRAGGDGHARRLRDIQHLEAQAAALAAERAALEEATQVWSDNATPATQHACCRPPLPRHAFWQAACSHNLQAGRSRACILESGYGRAQSRDCPEAEVAADVASEADDACCGISRKAWKRVNRFAEEMALYAKLQQRLMAQARKQRS